MKVTLELDDGIVKVVSHPPLFITRHNCFEVLGLTVGEFEAAVSRARLRGFDVSTSGRLLMVETEPFVAWLRVQRDRARRPANDGADGASPEIASPKPGIASTQASGVTERKLDQMASLAPVEPKRRG